MKNLTVSAIIENARVALAEFESYTQQQVDLVTKTVGKAIYDNAEVLAKEAVEETGYGRVDSKIIKQCRSTLGAWHYLHDKKSVGIIEEDTMNLLYTYAKPVGIVACISPSTNPTSTVGSNGMNILKCRNVMVVAPHPRAKKTTVHGVQLINEALAKIGAPANLVQIIADPTMEDTKELMAAVDVVVATGGAGMIKSAYSSGKPSFGVGPGNVQTIVAPDYDDYANIASTICASRSYDNGMPCTGEQGIHYYKESETALVAAFENAGAVLVADDKLDMLASVLFTEKGTLNPQNVGKTAFQIAALIGISVPPQTPLLLFKGTCTGGENILCKEKLCPVVQLFSYDNFKQAVGKASKNLMLEGAGHTATIYTNDSAMASYAAKELPVGRLVVNQPGGAASGGNFINGLAPTMSLGCGSWGNNSISENLTYRHLMNVTYLAYRFEESRLPEPDVVWAE